MTGFSNAADVLANNKILNFDADAYITGSAPRYVGAPDGDMQLPFDRPLPCTSYPTCYPGFGYFNPRLAPQPSADAFVSRHAHQSELPAWIAGILGTLGLTGLSAYIYRDKKAADTKAPDTKNVDKAKLSDATKKAETTANKAANTAKDTAKTFWQKTKDFFAKGWNKIKNFKIPGWGKVVLGLSAGAMVAYGIYRAFSKPSIEQQSIPQYPKYPG